MKKSFLFFILFFSFFAAYAQNILIRDFFIEDSYYYLSCSYPLNNYEMKGNNDKALSPGKGLDYLWL